MNLSALLLVVPEKYFHRVMASGGLSQRMLKIEKDQFYQEEIIYREAKGHSGMLETKRNWT